MVIFHSYVNVYQRVKILQYDYDTYIYISIVYSHHGEEYAHEYVKTSSLRKDHSSFCFRTKKDTDLDQNWPLLWDDPTGERHHINGPTVAVF